jgi:hypothetical protein
LGWDWEIPKFWKIPQAECYCRYRETFPRLMRQSVWLKSAEEIHGEAVGLSRRLIEKRQRWSLHRLRQCSLLNNTTKAQNEKPLRSNYL